MATRLTFFLFIQCCSCINVPVIILDSASNICFPNAVNPFRDVSGENFHNLVLDAIHKSDYIIVFAEEQFGVEDISSRDCHGTPYTNIHELFKKDKVKYMPRVFDPFKTLQELLPRKESQVIEIHNSDRKMLNKNVKYHFVHFLEPVNYLSETRVQKMRRHDGFITHAFNYLTSQRSGPVMVFYTGKSKRVWKHNLPYTRADKVEHSDTIMMVTNQALIRLTGVNLQQGPTRTMLVEPRPSSRRLAQRRASSRVEFDDELELDFNFVYLEDNWLLDNIVLREGGEEVGRTPMGVGAPYGWSYFCSEPVFIVNTRDMSYVTISKYQVEPQTIGRFRSLPWKRSKPGRDDEEPEETAPGDAVSEGDETTTLDPGTGELDFGTLVDMLINATLSKLADVEDIPPAAIHAQLEAAIKAMAEKMGVEIPSGLLYQLKFRFSRDVLTCGTNFNCRILAGLFVAFLCICIGSCGITVLYDCGRNDRMEDPTQKPLVIVAQL